MPDIVKYLRNISSKFYKDPANMLLVTGAASWVLGSMSQVAAIAVNDKLSQKEKKFFNSPRNIRRFSKCRTFCYFFSVFKKSTGKND